MIARPDRIRLNAGARRALRDEHPWIFDTWVESEPREAREAGALVAVYDARNRFAGLGLWDPTSPIRVRMIAHGPAPWGPALLEERLRAAAALRRPLADEGTTGYRVVHGPSEGLPGLVIDRYADVFVLKVYASSWIPWLGDVVDAMHAALGAETVVFRCARNVSAPTGSTLPQEGTCLRGALASPDGIVRFHERGLVFEAEPTRGQKTGFFLDQRENRARLRTCSQGKRVLNLFSFTGGFSLHAAAGGATRVTSVDISAHATAGAERNFAHNASVTEVAACEHEAVQDDVFRYVERARLARDLWDVVVVDPPAFAKSAKEREGALRAYGTLARRAEVLVADGGLLVFASCSSRVKAPELDEVLQEALRGRMAHRGTWTQTGHALDHPARFPEFEYLKCFWIPR